MPRSVLLGRPWPQPGEELFTQEDTDYAIALAEEEQDTCPSCGMPRAWCRGKGSQFTDYDVTQETCQASLRLAHFRKGNDWTAKHDETKQATHLSVRFRPGHAPPLDAGLEITNGGAGG